MTSEKDSGKQQDQDKSRRHGLPFDTLFNSLPGLATQTISKALRQSGSLLSMLLKTPDYMEQVGKAGRYLKDIREVAGLTLEDLARAIDLKSPDILLAVEEGRSPITLDILFRLASFYSRNDPFSFMFNFSREHAPWLWQALRITGMEKLLITMERELKFINVYRSRETARQLDEKGFDKMLGFVRSSFNMAMDFIEPLEKKKKGSSQKSASAVAPKKPTTAVTAQKASVNSNPGPSSGPRKAPVKKPVKKSPTAKR